MGKLLRLFNICMLSLFCSYPAHAQEALTPLNFKGVYTFTFAGAEFGLMGLEIAQNGSRTQMASDITTTGLVSLFVKHLSHSTLTGNGGNSIYESNYNTRKKSRYVKLISSDFKIKDELLIPADAPGKRSLVPADLKQQAHSPLDFLLSMREMLFKTMKDNENNYKSLFYDGRRLTRGHFTIEGRKTIRIGDKKYQTIKVAARRELVGGFTVSEIEDYDTDEPTVYLYYSNDERLVPLRAEFKWGPTTVAATLDKQCGDTESCLLNLDIKQPVAK
jgi:hypothetical protein